MFSPQAPSPLPPAAPGTLRRGGPFHFAIIWPGVRADLAARAGGRDEPAPADRPAAAGLDRARSASAA